MADQGDRVGLTDDMCTNTIQLVGYAAIQRGSSGSDDVGAGEGLALGQRTIGTQQVAGQLRALSVVEGAQRSVMALIDHVEPLVDLPSRPSDAVELIRPPAHK